MVQERLPSTDLVPRTYARAAFNILHGTNLEAHNDLLTAKQAARINDSYDIEVYVGYHGIVPEGGPVSARDHRELPEPQEYDEAAAVVAGMQPGDTLFLEGDGFVKPKDVGWEFASILANATTAKNTDFISRMAAELVAAMSKDVLDEEYRKLEQARNDRKITVWAYAQRLALLRGIDVVYADYDVFDNDGLQKLSGGKTLLKLIRSPNAEDRALARRMHGPRERVARNIMKDYALEHLPLQGAPKPHGRKPRLVMLFGDYHKEGLEQKFGDVGLNAKITVMQSTNRERRTVEHMSYALMDELLRSIVMSRIVASAGLVEVPPSEGGARSEPKPKN